VVAAPDVPTAVRRGVRLFNRGRYLAANQLWEDAWREAPPGDRAFLEGLVQLAGGLHLRTRRGGTRGAVHLVAQALVSLEDYAPATHGIDVARLLDEFAAYLDWVKGLDRPHRYLDRWRIPRLRAG
jgi:hypothetical protein